MDKAKIVRVVLMAIGGAVGALAAGGVLPAEPWATIAAALVAWQVPALGHSAKE